MATKCKFTDCTLSCSGALGNMMSASMPWFLAAAFSTDSLDSHIFSSNELDQQRPLQSRSQGVNKNKSYHWESWFAKFLSTRRREKLSTKTITFAFHGRNVSFTAITAFNDYNLQCAEAAVRVVEDLIIGSGNYKAGKSHSEWLNDVPGAQLAC